MGFFDRIVRDLTNNVIDRVERKAADEIINPQIDKIAENAKARVISQAAQAEDAIFNAPPVIALDKENYDNMLIASRGKLYFMDKVLEGGQKRVSIKLMSTLRFSTETCGDLSGNTDAANTIHSAVLDAIQRFFDDCSAKHMTMAAALENPKFISVNVMNSVKSILDGYSITNPQLLITYVIPTDEATSNGAGTPAEPASWACQYCGSINKGKFCENCGAPQQ